MADKPNTKIDVSDLEKLEHLLDQAPAHRDTAVSKRKAIGRLAPKLHAMRTKGYSWGAVAAWLTEHGLVVTTRVLNAYLRHGSPGTNSAAAQRPKAHRQRKVDTATVVSPPALAPEHAPVSLMPAQLGGSASNPVAKELPARRGDRRSEFPVRPDSDEI